MYRKLISLFISVNILFVSDSAALASDAIDMGALCSLTIDISYNSAPIQGLPLLIFKAASLNAGLDYELTEDFSRFGTDIGDISDSFQNMSSAARLLSYAESESLTGASKTTDAEGLVWFQNLSAGLYLISPGSVTGFYDLKPYLIQLPQFIENRWRYDIIASPKMEPRPTATPSPRPEDTHSPAPTAAPPPKPTDTPPGITVTPSTIPSDTPTYNPGNAHGWPTVHPNPVSPPPAAPAAGLNTPAAGSTGAPGYTETPGYTDTPGYTAAPGQTDPSPKGFTPAAPPSPPLKIFNAAPPERRPLVHAAGNTLISEDPDTFIEYDPNGVALGRWVWNPEAEVWEFTVEPPTGVILPRTGGLNWPIPVLSAAGLLFLIFGLRLLKKDK